MAARSDETFRRAVVAAGGFGTRLLPATQAVPKALLPIVDRPLLQYALEELARAGFDEIAVLARPEHYALADHLRPPEPLRGHLERRGEAHRAWSPDDAGSVLHLFPTSSETMGLGGQLLELAGFIADQPFALVFPDELCGPESSPWEGLREVYGRRGGMVAAVWGTDPLPDEWRVSSYRPLDDRPSSSRAPGAQPPGTARVIGRYLCSPGVLPLLERLRERSGTPLGINDLLAATAGLGALTACRFHGRWWDCGDRLGYLSAVLSLSLEHEELGPHLSELASELAGGVVRP